MTVPFMDLTAQYAPLREEVARAIEAVFARSAFAGGPFVERFEDEFRQLTGSAHAVGVGSGTEALWLALLAAGVGPGDEVITVSNSFFATAEAISWCGAEPKFVDVDPATLTLDPERLADAVSERTRAIVPVHLFGQCAEMEPILALAEARGIPVIEDAAQAHGATYKGRHAGSMGLAGCFSFYPGKNLGAPGEAGAVVTDDEGLARHMRALRDHGQVAKHEHRYIGANARMDGIHAAVLSVKLRHLERWNRERRERAQAYSDRLAGLPGLRLPVESAHNRHVFHLYALRASGRDALMETLGEAGIQTAIHYPVPIHLQPAYAGRGAPPGGLRVSEQAARSLVSLPLYPELGWRDLNRVCDTIELWVRAREAARAAPDLVALESDSREPEPVGASVDG